MHRISLALSLATLLVGATAANAGVGIDTGSCAGKQAWQRKLVEDTIRSWFEGAPRPENLIDLVQAEQGIAACLDADRPTLHTPRLPPGLTLPQLGALLLANELEWRGLVPPPEEALAGKVFRIAIPKPPADRAGR
jgi:hypothetical protein